MLATEVEHAAFYEAAIPVLLALMVIVYLESRPPVDTRGRTVLWLVSMTSGSLAFIVIAFLVLGGFVVDNPAWRVVIIGTIVAQTALAAFAWTRRGRRH